MISCRNNVIVVYNQGKVDCQMLIIQRIIFNFFMLSLGKNLEKKKT